MKHLYFILLAIVVVSLFSCSSSSNRTKHEAEQVEEQARLDSIRKDSILKAQIVNDSLSMIAWGDAKYGMSRKEVKQTVAFKGGDFFDNNTVTMTNEKMSKFANTFGLKELYLIIANFSEDELYDIEIHSWAEDAVYRDNLTDDCSIFAKNFTERYGKPSYINESTSWSYIKDRSEITLMRWNIEGKNGIKYIKINMSRIGYKYMYKISIWNDGFPKKKHVPTSEEIEKEKKDKAEKDMVKATSF